MYAMFFVSLSVCVCVCVCVCVFMVFWGQLSRVVVVCFLFVHLLHLYTNEEAIFM